MAESPVEINARKEEVEGQPQSKERTPHDGKHLVHEVAVTTDRVILDPNDPLAVQVPEGVGASTYGHAAPLGEALEAGHVEDRFVDEKPARRSRNGGSNDESTS